MNHLLEFQDIVDRAKKAFKISEDKELSDIIGMSNQAFYNRKKTKSLPYDELLLAANRRNIDFNWLLTGEGDMYRNEEGEFDPQTLAIARMVKGLDPLEKNGIESFVSDKKFIHEMKRRDTRQSA